MMMINLTDNPRLLYAANGILGVLVLATIIYMGGIWYLDWQLAHQTAATPTRTDNASNRMIASLPNQHLFGIAATGDMPISNLELRVTGIVRQQDNQNTNISKAYISISGAPSKIYQVGDSLPDGVKIYEITPDTVILENAGQLEKLPLPRGRLTFKPRDNQESY